MDTAKTAPLEALPATRRSGLPLMLFGIIVVLIAISAALFLKNEALRTRLTTLEARVKEMENAAPRAPQREGDVFVIRESDLLDARAHRGDILGLIRGTPFFSKGTIVGVRVFQIAAASIFRLIGLENGDVILDIDGSSPKEVGALVDDILDKTEAEGAVRTVRVKRRVDEVTIQFKAKSY